MLGRPDPHSIREGSGKGRSDSRELDRDHVRWFHCLRLVLVELMVTMAGVILQPKGAAESLARGRGDGPLPQGPQASC